jgi:anti-sigma regulatory factor (Ser/Thr protein kinase)
MSTGDGVVRDEPTDAAGSGLDVSLNQPFDFDNLVALRSAVAAHGDRLGLAPSQVQELVLVAHELASNAVRHGGGHGRLRMWKIDRTVHCEVTDSGPGMPDAHPETFWRPSLDALGGRGLWLAHRLSDHFDLRSSPDGTTATATMRTS